jgi:hypothetical protein
VIPVRSIENLEYLGVVTMPEAKRKVMLTPAGVPVAVALIEETGTTVEVRSAPALASAGEIVDLVGQIDTDEWHAEASAWFAAQTDPATAAGELVTEITAEYRERLAVAHGLQAVGAVVGEHAVAAVRLRKPVRPFGRPASKRPCAVNEVLTSRTGSTRLDDHSPLRAVKPPPVR